MKTGLEVFFKCLTISRKSCSPPFRQCKETGGGLSDHFHELEHLRREKKKTCYNWLLKEGCVSSFEAAIKLGKH